MQQIYEAVKHLDTQINASQKVNQLIWAFFVKSFLIYEFLKENGLIKCLFCDFYTTKGTRGFNIHLSRSSKGCRAKLVEVRNKMEHFKCDVLISDEEDEEFNNESSKVFLN
jgi:hypothetical protein